MGGFDERGGRDGSVAGRGRRRGAFGGACPRFEEHAGGGPGDL